MRASIFFDMRAVAGNAGLVYTLRQTLLEEVKRQPVFLAHLARNAMARTPPLGLFRQIVLEKEGTHAATLDLKHRGLVPIIDLARFLALEAGCSSPKTLQRLRAAQERGGLSSEGLSELRAAFELIALLRLQHQARCVSRSEAPDSFIHPDELSAAERRHLRDAFRVVKATQDSIHLSHQLGDLSG